MIHSDSIDALPDFNLDSPWEGRRMNSFLRQRISYAGRQLRRCARR